MSANQETRNVVRCIRKQAKFIGMIVHVSCLCFYILHANKQSLLATHFTC